MKQTEIDRKKKKTKQREKRYKEVNACVYKLDRIWSAAFCCAERIETILVH